MVARRLRARGNPCPAEEIDDRPAPVWRLARRAGDQAARAQFQADPQHPVIGLLVLIVGLHQLLPGGARGGGPGAALRRVRAGPTRPELEDAVRHRDGPEGARPAPVEGGVRLPHRPRRPAQLSTPRAYEDEANMLTGDLNAANVQWVVQYGWSTLQLPLPGAQPASTFRGMSEAVMRRDRRRPHVNEVLTVGRAEVATRCSRVAGALRPVRHRHQGGPGGAAGRQSARPGQASFNEVNEAQQEREKLINQAQSEYNRVIPRAEARPCRPSRRPRVRLQRVNEARGDSSASWPCSRSTARRPR